MREAPEVRDVISFYGLATSLLPFALFIPSAWLKSIKMSLGWYAGRY